MNFYPQLDLNKTKHQHCGVVRFVTVRYVWLLIWELLKVYNISGRSHNNRTKDALHSMKNSGLEFPVMKETAFSWIFRKKRTTVRGIYKFSKIHLFTKWIFMQFCFSLGIWLIDFSEIQQFPDFLENFPRISCTICQIVKILEFLANGKCLIATLSQSSKSCSYCFNLLLLLPVVQEMLPNLTGFHCVWKTCHPF